MSLPLDPFSEYIVNFTFIYKYFIQLYILDFDSNIVLTPYSKAVKLDRGPWLTLLPSKDGYVKPISILKGKW